MKRVLWAVIASIVFHILASIIETKAGMNRAWVRAFDSSLLGPLGFVVCSYHRGMVFRNWCFHFSFPSLFIQQ